MRAHVEKTASPIPLAVAAIISILLSSPECSAQIEPVGGRHLVLFIYNYCDHAIAPGEVELREIRDGREQPISTISTEAIARDEYTWTHFPDPLVQGNRYRIIFRADCVNEGSKIIYRESRAFVFRYSENWRSLNIDRDDLRDRGNLVRLDFGKGLNSPDVVFAKPGDLIEIDYISQGVQASVEPKGGSHPDVVAASSVGPRPIVVNGKTVGIASFFEAKSRGDDWVSVEVDGTARNYHIFVRSK
jgi:hypothetical protein